MQWNNTGFTVNFKYWAMYVSSHIKKKNNSEKTPELFLICIHVLLFFLIANVNITLLPLPTLFFYIQITYNVWSLIIHLTREVHTFLEFWKKYNIQQKFTLTVSNGILQFFLPQQSLYTELYEKFITPDCPCTN